MLRTAYSRHMARFNPLRGVPLNPKPPWFIREVTMTGAREQPHIKVDKPMKYQKLVDELNNLLDLAAKEQKKRRDTMKFYQAQFMAEEQKLRKKLKRSQR